MRMLLAVGVGSVVLLGSISLTGCKPGESGPPELLVSPDMLEFGEDATEMSFDIENTGGGELVWSVSCSSPWISLSPENGTNDATITVTVDRDSPRLGIGTNLSLILIDTPIGDALVAATVVMTAEGGGGPDPEVGFAPAELHFDDTSTKTLTIYNTGGGTLDWSIAPDAAWLSVFPDSGTGYTPVTVTLDRGAMPLGPQTAALNITSTGGDVSVPVIAYGYDASRDYGLPAYFPLAVGNEWTWAHGAELWRIAITGVSEHNGVQAWAFTVEDNYGSLGDYHFVYAEAQDALYVLHNAADLDSLPDVPYSGCHTWDDTCSFALWPDMLTPGPLYDPYYYFHTTAVPGPLGDLLTVYGVTGEDTETGDLPVGDPEHCIGFTEENEGETTLYTIFAPGVGPVVWDYWELRHAMVGGVEYGAPVQLGAGLARDNDPGNDVVYLSRQDDGTKVYYCGFETITGTRITHAFVEDAFGVVGGTIIFSDGYIPVQWILDNLTIAVYDLPPGDPEVAWDFDPAIAQHVAVSYGDQTEFTLDINPGDLRAVADEFELETGYSAATLDNFIARTGIDTWPALVDEANTHAGARAPYQIGALAFSTAAAVSRLPDLSAKLGVSNKVLSVAGGAALSLVNSAVFDEICLHCPGADEPTVEVAICQGTTGIMLGPIEICHYCFFRVIPLTDCTHFCHASMGCFTGICAPTEISADAANDWRFNTLDILPGGGR